MATSAFLRQVPLFADLSDELVEQLVAEAGQVHVCAGEWLLREGAEAESLYLVRSGRLEVVDEGPPETLIRAVRRGQALGELALLGKSARTASVRASRDSELIELGRDRFDALISSVPAFAIGLTRTMGAQLAANRAPAAASRPRTIAVLALDDGAPAPAVAQLLARALRDHGSVAELSADRDRSGEAMATALDRAEASSDRVVLTAAATVPGNEWSDLYLREADLIVAVTQGKPAPAWIDRPAGLKGCELLVTGPGIGADVIAAFAPRETRVVRERADLQQRVEAMARRFCGKALGVVFSGGGARSFAHLGVMDEINAAGLKIDRIAGVSMGAVIGAGIALGHEPGTLADRLRAGISETNPTGDYSLPLFSLIRGRSTRKLLEPQFGDHRIEELPISFFCLSCDLVAREAVIHRTGPLIDAVFASVSIPGVFPPIATEDGRLLVDGGVLDNLPVEAMAGALEGPIIAVDVGGRLGDFRRPTRPGIARLARPLRRFLTGSEAQLPSLAETAFRTVTVGSIDTAIAARRHADLVIEPEVDDVGLLGWNQLDRAREAGRRAARSALEGFQDGLGSHPGGGQS